MMIVTKIAQFLKQTFERCRVNTTMGLALVTLLGIQL